VLAGEIGVFGVLGINSSLPKSARKSLKGHHVDFTKVGTPDRLELQLHKVDGAKYV